MDQAFDLDNPSGKGRGSRCHALISRDWSNRPDNCEKFSASTNALSLDKVPLKFFASLIFPVLKPFPLNIQELIDFRSNKGAGGCLLNPAVRLPFYRIKGLRNSAFPLRPAPWRSGGEKFPPAGQSDFQFLRGFRSSGFPAQPRTCAQPKRATTGLPK